MGEGTRSRSQPILASNGQIDAAPSGPDSLGRYRYGKWSISYDPPPIPGRSCDWAFSHDDFDASYEGEEDGWVGNGLCGHAGSLKAAVAEIDAIDEDRFDCHCSASDPAACMALVCKWRKP